MRWRCALCVLRAVCQVLVCDVLQDAGVVYYIGLVDMTTLYELGKKMERASLVLRPGVSSVRHFSLSRRRFSLLTLPPLLCAVQDTASVIPPGPYQSRLVKFITDRSA
jgi:hypothetical protein